MIPFQITFRDFPESDAVWLAVQKRVEKLETFFNNIVKCDVVISMPHRHRHAHRIYHIKIHLSMAGKDVFIDRDPEENEAHTDIYVAIRDAFNSAERILQDRARKMRGEIKDHRSFSFGKITRLFPDDGYGFIASGDGREIYFHSHCLLGDDFNQLKVGRDVRFTEEAGEKGPQVSSMALVGKMKRARLEKHT